METNKYLPRITRPAAADFRKVIGPGLSPQTSAVDIILSFDSENVNLRDLSRFLFLVDRVYGRLLCGDLKKYAWDDKAQLHISSMRPGSWEIVLTQLLGQIPDPTAIFLLYIFLKVLPRAINESADAVLKLTTAYNNYEQGRLARANRKKLRREMDKDEDLRTLSSPRKKQLAEVIDLLIREDPSISNPALRFSEISFRSVTIRLRGKDKHPDGN